jgi:hypothetical protein
VAVPTTISDTLAAPRAGLSPVRLGSPGDICIRLILFHIHLEKTRERDVRRAEIQRLSIEEEIANGNFIKKEILKNVDVAIVFGCCG